jgi:hypothetical protein
MGIAMSARLSACGTYRWTLSRSWGQGRTVCWILLNPSTADHARDDPTSRRVLHFTQAWGYHGLTIVNLYPFRSPRVSECREWATGNVSPWLRRNIHHIRREVRAADRTIAAWGNNAWDRALVAEVVLAATGGGGHRLECLGTTRSGAPIHPGARGSHRVPDHRMPMEWVCGG